MYLERSIRQAVTDYDIQIHPPWNGTFFLRPLPGLKYYFIIRGADSIDIKTELPASFQQV